MPSVMILPSGTTGPAVTGLSSFCSLRDLDRLSPLLTLAMTENA